MSHWAYHPFPPGSFLSHSQFSVCFISPPCVAFHDSSQASSPTAITARWSGTWWLRRNKTGTKKVLMVNVSTWQFAVKVTEAIYWCSAKATQRTLAEHAHVPLVTCNLPLRRQVRFGVTDIITITKYPTSDPWEELDWNMCDLDAVGEWELV